MTTPKYDIYIYQLTNGKYLLYPTNNGFLEDTVKKECGFIYYECLCNTKIVLSCGTQTDAISLVIEKVPR